jgi:L-ascorbate metabolism protein UlaG (beta-lactamase superfamily)
MHCEPTRRTGAARPPGGQSGGATIATFAILLMLLLAAGVSTRAARMLGQSSPPPVSAAPGGAARADAARFAGEAPGAPRRLSLPSRERPGGNGPPAEGSVTWIGEATVLIRSHGMTVLTDPTFLRRGEPARIVPGMPHLRRSDPAIDIEDLPPIDLIVLSRLREDHFDRLARRRLPRDVPIVVPAAARAELVAMGFASVHALQDWGGLRFDRGDAWLQLTATPTRTGPPGIAALLPVSMGTLLEFGGGEVPPNRRIWISGDTGIDEALLAELGPRLADLDLALLHVGGTAVLGLGGSMDAAASLRAIARLAPRTAIALRLEDFGGEAPRPTPAALARAAQGVAVGASPVRRLERGSSHRFAPLQQWALAQDAPSAAGR